MGQIITKLSPIDAERLEKQRDLVTGYLDPTGMEKFQTVAGKLGTLRAMLEIDMFRPEQTYALQSMGVVLGDAFVQDIGFHWVMVKDDYGHDPAIRYRETSVLLFPLTMISKRVEQGEKVDVLSLYNGIADVAHEKIDEELNLRK